MGERADSERANSESLRYVYFVCVDGRIICFKPNSVFVVGVILLKICLLASFEALLLAWYFDKFLREFEEGWRVEGDIFFFYTPQKKEIHLLKYAKKFRVSRNISGTGKAETTTTIFVLLHFVVVF